MTSLLGTIAGLVSTLIALVGICFIMKIVFKTGLKASLIGIFFIVCIASYLVNNLHLIPELGELIVTTITTEVSK